MTEIKNYKLDFIARTLELLNENFESFKERDKETTFLLNCLLGLIVLTCENEKEKCSAFNGKIDNRFVNVIPQKVRFLANAKHLFPQDILNKDTFSINVSNHSQLKKMDKIWFLKMIRNGISHQNIDVLNADGTWVGIKLWNINPTLDVKDFEIEFKIQELKPTFRKVSTEI